MSGFLKKTKPERGILEGVFFRKTQGKQKG